MASVTIRMDDEKRDELERLARERGSTVSDMLRIAIDGLLRRDVPLTLDMVARRQLALSHEILAHLDPDSDAKRAHRRSIRVLSKGYRSEYDREFYSFDTEIPLADSSLIMDLFDMFSVLETALNKLDADAVAALGEGAEHLLRFGGFDYQDRRESQLAGFAEHLIDDDRWTNLAHHFGDRPGEPRCPDSHSRKLELYQRMLAAYDRVTHARATPDGMRGIEAYRLDVDDLQVMFAATRYPSPPSW
jgi:uncharacterized protein YfbU (UPF0304 family)